MIDAAELEKYIRTIEDFPKKGISFKDITPLLQDPARCEAVSEALIAPFHQAEAVAGIESRGFLLGMAMARMLKVPFIPIRKAGKLPGPSFRTSYSLEYGEAIIELQKSNITKGMKILLHDDLLATGGTAGAAAKLIEEAECELLGFSFLIELTYLQGRRPLSEFAPVHSLLTY